jgi:serine/threonine protein kinase
MPLQPGTRLGSYEVLSPLGTGGMGEVYRARQVRLQRDVAIKVLPADLAADPDRLRRFEREARAASALNHPGIVTIYDIDDHEGTRYIAMELVEGTTLRGRMSEGRLDAREALRLATQIAEGLARAHGAGIVHRDLKPDNVMVTSGGLVKILDFGLAKHAAGDVVAGTDVTTMSRATQDGVLLGTVPYMSPEQAAGRVVDHLSDQFSFGTMLYEMLCGQRPFQGDSVATVLSAILRDTPRPPRELRPDTPRDLARVVQTCLAKDPRRRFGSTEEDFWIDQLEVSNGAYKAFVDAGRLPRFAKYWNPAVSATARACCRSTRPWRASATAPGFSGRRRGSWAATPRGGAAIPSAGSAGSKRLPMQPTPGRNSRRCITGSRRPAWTRSTPTSSS